MFEDCTKFGLLFQCGLTARIKSIQHKQDHISMLASQVVAVVSQQNWSKELTKRQKKYNKKRQSLRRVHYVQVLCVCT